MPTLQQNGGPSKGCSCKSSQTSLNMDLTDQVQLSIVYIPSLLIIVGDDGGSCIDGRLTSAWNWCSKLHKKPYYYVFMFTGFQGFDGDWKEN